jgi:competence protein ComEC
MDDIQRKLDLIDAQLAGRADLHNRIVSTAPLIFPALGLIIGILVQNGISGSQIAGHAPQLLWLWFIPLALFATATVVVFVRQRSSANHQAPPTNYQYVTAYLALACFTCLGAVRLVTFHTAGANDVRNLVADERKLATIRGLIVTDPHINKNHQWQFRRFTPADPTTSFYLKLSKVQAASGWAHVTGTVRVQVNEPVLDLKAGDCIQAYCWLDRFNPPTNPGQFNVAQYLARKNIFIAAAVKSRDGMEIIENRSQGAFANLKSKVRRTASKALLTGLDPDDDNQALLQALLLGYRADIDPATYRAFRETGLLHLISLSGMHLGILIGTIWWLAKLIGLMKRARAAVCIIAIAIFLLIVPPRAPTVRAAIIGWVFCASLLFKRRPNSLNTLSLAAIILLLIRPTGLFEAGWQLSFASVLGILLFCRRTHLFLYEKITGLPWLKKSPKTKPFFRIVSRPGPYLLALFTTGLTAWLGGAGILLYHFYSITPLTCIWTVAVFPLVWGILTLGFLKIILSFMLPTAAVLLGLIVTALSNFLIWVVTHIADLHISQILIGHVPLAVPILYYAFILFAGFAHFRRPLMKKIICAATASALIIFLGVAKGHRTYRDVLVLTCLDVGHGQAVLAQLPGRANLLFDAGSLHKQDVGRRTVLPFLEYSGISRLDAIIISHNDSDHINGIPEIVQDCSVRAVYANDAFFAEPDTWGTANFLNEWLTRQGYEVQRLGRDLNFSRRAAVQILWPPREIADDVELTDNDKSLVVLIECAGRRVLLCSDIEEFAQQELLRLYPNLTADIVIAPHHGSMNTLDQTFLQSLHPTILICSCAKTARQKRRVVQPPNVAQCFYTPTDGAVTVRISKDGRITTGAYQKK